MKGILNSELSEKLIKTFEASSGLDCILIINTESRDPNFTYFSGLKGPFEHDVLIIKKNTAVLLASSLEYENALAQKKVRVVKRVKNSRFLEKNVKYKKVGLNASFLPMALYSQIKKKYRPKKIVDVSGALAEARLVKTSSELKKIKKAVEITKKAFREIPGFFKSGVSEKQLALIFDELLLKFGSEENAFKTIVAFGKNSALPHHEPGESKLKKGDLILIDAGAKFKGYCSDLTRTFVFEADYEKFKVLFDCVEEARSLILNSLKPGVDFKKIKELFEYVLKKNGFNPIHAFGHSVGVEVHEPAVGKIKKGMVVAVEPGVYVEGFGGVRVEDDFLITEKSNVEL